MKACRGGGGILPPKIYRILSIKPSGVLFFSAPFKADVLERRTSLLEGAYWRGGLLEKGAYRRRGLIGEGGLSEKGAYRRRGLIGEGGLLEKGLIGEGAYLALEKISNYIFFY